MNTISLYKTTNCTNCTNFDAQLFVKFVKFVVKKMSLYKLNLICYLLKMKAIHIFQFRHFAIRQGQCAMKVGTDGTLLGAWASVPEGGCADVTRILDIGTGTGLIALMMAQRFPRAVVTGIDIDGCAVAQAAANVEASPFAGRVTMVRGDVRTTDFGHQFDAIVCNPPFFANSLESPDARRTLARHAVTLSLRELMSRCRCLLADGGELSVVTPCDSRSTLESEAFLSGFFKVRQWAVRTTAAKAPRRLLTAFRKHPAQTEVAEIVIGSEKYFELTKDFYL